MSHANAQGIDVRGIVADSASGERIPFANISISGTNRGASTNVNGFYLIANVPQGSYDISASAVGFQRAVKTVSVRGSEPVTVNFNLPQRTVEFSEIVVESERNLEKLDAASIHVLGPQELQQIPAAGQNDVLRSLLILPGIVSTSDVSSKFFVRGGAGDQNLILLDGMRMYNPFHAFGIFSVFDPDLINTTEVFTGAFPAGYGNRLSSVVNMTTKQGNTKRLAAKGEVNFLNGKLQLEGPIKDDNSWLVNGRTSLSDRAFKHFLRNPVPISFYDLFIKATIGNETGRNSFRGFLSGDEVTGKPDEPDHSWTSKALAASLAGLASDRIYVDGVVYTSSFKVKRDSKQSTTVQPAESRVSDDGIRLEVTFHTETSGAFITGFQFDLPEYQFRYSTPSNVERTFETVDTELWLWFRHLREYQDFQTDLGIHVDLASLIQRGPNLQAFQPRLSLRYNVAELWRLRLSYGSFNQHAITISNEDDITSLFEAWIAVPENLRAEEAHHFVFGIEGLLSTSFTLDLQTYYKYYPSLVLYNREKFFSTDPDYINGTGKSYGAELLARFGVPLADLYLSYSLGWTNVTTGGFTYSPRYDRRHTINALGVFHPLENIDISVRWEFGTGYPYTQTLGYYDRLLFGNIGGGPLYGETGIPYSILGDKNAARLPAYYRIDASATYHFAVPPIRGSFGISAANLTNRKNILFYDRKTGQTIYMLDFFPSATLKLEL
jgi:outer membrane cobalamin receptor